MPKKSPSSKTPRFKITKLKEYDGDNINEKLFFDGLFTKNTPIGVLNEESNEQETTYSVDEVTSSYLYNKFYKITHKILDNIEGKNKNIIFEESSTSKKKSIIKMIIATYCIITILPILIIMLPALEMPKGLTYTIVMPTVILFTLLFTGLGFTILFSFMFQKKLNQKIAVFVFGFFLGGLSWAKMLLPLLVEDRILLIGYALGLSCIFGMTICLKYVSKRTPYGNEMLGKIRGFKTFLETAEKERLEAMVMQDPSYFYNILPYAYVLDVSNVWIEKFEAISLQAPSWYDSTNAFDASTFGAFLSSTMSSAENAFSYMPSSSGGSSRSSSGGGSSGGGSGGGGGSSW